jgi:hypothetical protein
MVLSNWIYFLSQIKLVPKMIISPYTLRHYGKTLQIKFHYVDDFFEGHASVILDTSVKPDKSQRLTRNLYLD